MDNRRLGWLGAGLVAIGVVAIVAGAAIGGTGGPAWPYAGMAGWGPGMMGAWGGGTVTASAVPRSSADGSNPSANGVHLAGSQFSPATITVSVGTSVTWLNDDSVPHTVTASDRSWSSGYLAPGATYERTFTRAGTYSYVCLYHPWMLGTLTVQ